MGSPYLGCFAVLCFICCCLDALGKDERCPVCYQKFSYPVKLPCGHVFCYLCVKGFSASRAVRRCALCRSDIPVEYVRKPTLVADVRVEQSPLLDDGCWWFYEGKSRGWWKYDERTARDIERAFQAKEKSVEVQIVGHIYVVDFELMAQYRKSERGRTRKIKRDKLNLAETKGVAGLYCKRQNGDTQDSGECDVDAADPRQMSEV